MTREEACGDCISREAVIKTISEWLFSKEFHYTNATEYLRKRLDELPPVSPQPKMGKWVKTSLTGVSGGDFKRGFRCSHCNYVIVTNDFNFCPNCGAKMQEVEE